MTRTSAQIRRDFIDFFVQKHGHVFVPSSPVVPHDDPTLLFTNAGMNQFKPFFLGTAQPAHRRVANTQKCIRAGGKHNDLDDVGHDTYHHTFFEMLGNWSFGDYFKKEAIEWAWELLTKVWGVDPERLHATYFGGDSDEGLEPDTEARDLWQKILPAQRVHPGNKKDNFWEMGDTGPCGPCSEIHVDLTPDKSGAKLVNAGDPRVMEIWNLVFIQFNRGPDGKLTPLPAKHVDTGMGFERITALLQGKKSNYDTDVFTPIFAAIQRVTGAPAYTGLLEASSEERDQRRDQGSRDARDSKRSDVMKDVAYRVVADHIRTLTFAITDGAFPGNEGRSFVLRRILRRAVRYGRQHLGTHKPFLCELVPAVVGAMGEAFAELRTAHAGKNAEHVATILREEEESFGRTLDRGIALFAEAAERAKKRHHGRIQGEDAFKLHDTYGFPIDLTELMAQEQGLTVDIGEYERRMEEAREKARSSGGGDAAGFDLLASQLMPTDDSAKYAAGPLDAVITSILVSDGRGNASRLKPGEPLLPGMYAAIVVDKTCFYAEQGGQIGDRGRVISADGVGYEFEVETTVRAGDRILHLGRLTRGALAEGQTVVLHVDSSRAPIMQNHTSTHLLNWALREVLGDHVQQKGSLVDDQKTRFDFSHQAAVSEEELQRIERLVNERIAANLSVYAREVPQKEALKINGLRAVFGEKYPDIVRVVSIGAAVEELMVDPASARWRQFSVEFCGGTHLKSTGEAKRFRLIEESAVARGVRRVTGITGERAAATERAAAEFEREMDAAVTALADLEKRFNAAELPVIERNRLREKLAALQDRARQAEKQQARARTGDVLGRVDAMLADAARVGGTAIVTVDLGEATADDLRVASDALRSKAGSAAVLLAARSQGRVILLAAMTPDVVNRGVKAGELIKEIAPLVGGKGGGRPDMAQGGGTDAGKISEAVTAARNWLQSKFSA